MSAPNQYLSGPKFRLDRLRALLHAWKIARHVYPTISDAWTAFRGMAAMALENARIRHIQKGVVLDKRVYTLMGIPGRPSPAFDLTLKNELHRCLPIPGYSGGLGLLLFAFTKKCPLQCEHCFEWEALNHKESLALGDIFSIVRKFQDYGVAQIELSGGEPLNRLDDMLEVLRQSDAYKTDFWMLTSGYHLTPEKARQLKSAGLRGVSISLDHWNEADHDRFRGHAGAYNWALQATQHARNAGLLVSLSLVPTHSFCTPENLWRYADLARELQVHFIRILEPRAAGHYNGLPVELTDAELAVCEQFVQEIQARSDYPPVEYHATFQRKAGCGGGGKRYLYVDTDGDVHACPFCRRKVGSALTESVPDLLESLRGNGGCPAFNPVGGETFLSAEKVI